MDASLIALIYSVLISLFIIFGIFWGLIRGFKKTLFRGIFLVVSAVLVFGITRLVSSAFANMDITWMNINVNGVVPSNIEELISESLKASLEEEIALGLIDSIDVILSFVELFVSVILFWLLFILFKYLLLPLNYLLYKLIFRSAEEKEYARLKKMNKKMHGKVNAFVNGNDEFIITPINQHGDKEDKSSNVQTKKGSSKKVSKERKYSNGFKIQNKNEFVPLNEYVPNFDAEQESVDNQVTIQKPKKRRLVGALMGIPVGLFCGAMMLMPLNGFMSLAQEVNKQKAVAMQSEEGYVQAITNGAYEDIEKGYNNSLGNYVMTYTGAKFVSTLTFNTITTRKINGTKVKLKDDLVKTIETVNDVYEITQIDFNNVTQEEMNTNLNKIDEVVEKVLNIGIVKALLKTGVAIGSDYIINSEMDLGEFDSIVKASFDALKNIDSNAISNELRGVVNIAKTLNAKLEETSESLLTMIIKGDKIDVDVLSKITDDNIDSVIDSLFDFENYRMTTTSSIIPELVELGFNAGEGLINEFMANETNKFVYSDNAETIENLGSKDELVESIKNVLKGTLKVIKSSEDGIGYAIKDAGPVLDELSKKKLIGKVSYSSLISAVEEYANKIATDALKDVVSEKEINELTNSLSDITNWGTECEHLGKAYTIYEENNTEDSPMFPKNANDKLDIKNIKFDKLGEILDLVSNSQTLTKSKINELIADIIEKQLVKTANDNYKINGVELELSGDFKNQLIANIDRLTSYENELALIQSILIGDEPILDIDQLKEDVFANLGMLGGALDQLTNGTSSLNKSELFTDELIVSVFSDLMLDYKKTGENLTDLEIAFNELIDNVIGENGTLIEAVEKDGFSWENEFNKISTIKDLELDNLSNIGSTLDSVVGGENPSLIITNSELVEMVKAVVESYKTTGENISTEDKAINDVIEEIIKDDGALDNAVTQDGFSWETELTKLESLNNLDLTKEYSVIGENLDNAIDGSKILSDSLVVVMFNKIVESYKFTENDLTVTEEAINTLLDDVEENLNQIVSKNQDITWKNELSYLSELASLKGQENIFESGTALENASKSGSIITDELIAKMLITIINGYEKIGESLTDNQTAINTLLERIEENLTNEKIDFNWEKEINHVKNLEDKLESLTSINSESINSLSSIGDVLDNIAFNYDDESKNSDIITKSAIVELMQSMIDSLKYTNLQASDENYVKKLLINNFLAGDIDGDATNNSTNSTVGISLAGLDKDFNWETAKNETVGAGFKWTNEFKCLNYVVDEINKSTSSDLATLINVATNAILEVERKCNIIIYNV